MPNTRNDVAAAVRLYAARKMVPPSRELIWDQRTSKVLQYWVAEARRRGIGIEIIDADSGYFALNFGGRRIVCRESLSDGDTLIVRKTANLHTGGTIHDVTTELSPALADAARKAARALDIPLTGLDFLVPDVPGPDYVTIEANERTGFANHEPQPTAKRFVDLLFPQTIRPETFA